LAIEKSPTKTKMIIGGKWHYLMDIEIAYSQNRD
jgi:hypothetical protein